MKRLFFAIWICLQVSVYAEEEPIYQLVKQYKNADLDYEFIKNINSIEVPYPQNSHFQIGDFKYKKGNYLILKFQSVEFGTVSYSEDKIPIHKILILKVKGKKIIDGYHYTLEWQDVPSYALFKISNKVNLKPNLKLDDLKLLPVEEEQSKSEFFPGILDNVIEYKKIFP